MTQLKTIEKPYFTEEEKEHVNNLFLKLDAENSKKIHYAIKKTCFPEYLSWKQLKYRDWIPNKIGGEEITREQFWCLIKNTRKFNSQESTIRDDNNNYFSWIKLPQYDEFLHEIDRDTCGYLGGIKNISSSNEKEYISRGILEEAIASSQIEGAHTTRSLAKKMIQEKRNPRDDSENMILNNYNAMQKIESEYCNVKLSKELLFEMHKMLTQNTKVPLEKQGVFRKNEDLISVGEEVRGEKNETSYMAPSMEFVEQELARLIDFANDEDEDEGEFIHPLIKAIMLHFWLAILHPFFDGNGRLARALFYWYLLRKGYWAFAYLPISTIIKKNKAQYPAAFINSEQDDNDLTYFIDFNIRKIKKAQKEFIEYVKVKQKEGKQAIKIAKKENNLNERQIALLQYLNIHKDDRTNPSMHKDIYKITRATATSDLKELEKEGYLTSQKHGKYVYYYPTDKVRELFTK